MKVEWVVVAGLLEMLSCACYTLAFLQVFERAPFRVGAYVALSRRRSGLPYLWGARAAWRWGGG
jgi:hypothetical protein